MFMKNIQSSAETAMSVDCPIQASLKRSSSAPMINEIKATMSISSPTTPAPPRDAVSSFTVFSSLPRARRFSTSSPGGVVGLGISPRLTPRVNQLRREECIDVVAGREVAHEKEIHSAMQISQSWEDLTFETDSMSFKDSSTESPPSTMLTTVPLLLPNLRMDKQTIPKKIFDPLSLNVSIGATSACSSPSPTRSGLGQRQCYSPSLHAVAWKNGSLSPSPTRKAFATRRSLSPISIRPSCLGGSGVGVKRKFELDESMGMDRLIQPPIKRAFNLLSNPSRAESGLSSFSSVTVSSTGSVGTPESLSSADSPNFLSQLTEESSPSSSRTLLQSDDTSMSDSSNDPQQLKSSSSSSMEADVVVQSTNSGPDENACSAGGDNR